MTIKNNVSTEVASNWIARWKNEMTLMNNLKRKLKDF